MQDKQKAIVAKISESQSTVRERNRELMSLPLEELQSQMAHWRTNAAVAQRAMVEAEKRLSEQRELLGNNQRRRQSLVQRKNSNQEKLAELEVEKSGLRQQEDELNVQIEALTTKIEPR